MTDLSDFLRIRVVPEEVISLMEDQKIDSDVIVLMDDATLANYIPSYGDRIAIFNFCRGKKPLSKRKQGLLEKLREKMKLRKENDNANTRDEESAHSHTRKTQTKKLKTTRTVEIGWIHSDGEQIAKQVRTKQGGGTRKVQLDINAGLTDILQEGKKLFFTGGISPKGSESDLDFEVWDFKQNVLIEDTCLSIGTMYETAKLTMLRVYIATKPKEIQDNASDNSDVIVVSASEGDEGTAAEPNVEDIQDSPILISWDSEITFGPLFGVEGDTENTLIYEEPLPTSPGDPEDVITITIHHTNTLTDMITAFSDGDILKKHVIVRRTLSDNKEEAGSGSGLLRDVLSCFWQEFYERCTLGTTVKVPFIRHDFPAETWNAIGRILLKGYQECQYLPNKLALPFLERVLFNTVYSDLKGQFLYFVSTQEREVLMQAMAEFTAVDSEDLIEVLDTYGCRRKITAETFPTILDEIAHKELVQKPMFVIDCWREVTNLHFCLSPEALTKAFSDLQPTTKKVCKLLQFGINMTPKQKEVANHLKRFVRELDENKLEKILRFCTGSDLVVTDCIYVEFAEMTEYTRRPIAHTCGNLLKLADSYDNFPDFRSEFNAVLESNVWVMDIV